jgi:VanZ family protein
MTRPDPTMSGPEPVLVLRWALFAVALIGASLIALAPSATIAALPWPYWRFTPDPILHFAGFLALGLAAWFAHPKGAWLLGALGIYAVMLEVLQSVLHTGRGASFWDALANGLGLAAAALIGVGIEMLTNRGARKTSA